MYLLDVNVLIAVLDPQHVHHNKAADWFLAKHRDGGATCPLTENGVIRITGHPNYPGGTGSTDIARSMLLALISQPGHQFWQDNLSLGDVKLFPKLPNARHLTDVYLLALAVENKGQLITLDKRIDATLLSGGAKAYSVI